MNVCVSIRSIIVLGTVALVLGACSIVPNTATKSDVLEDIKSRFSQRESPDQIGKTDIFPDKLSEDTAVQIALWHNAAFQETLVDLDISRADLVNAGLLTNPDLMYSFGVHEKPYKYAISLPIEAIWLRPLRVDIKKQEASSVRYRLTQSGLNLIRDVRQSYAKVVLAEDKLHILKSSSVLRNNIYELVQKKFSAGDATRQDVTRAQLEALQAKKSAELAEYDLEHAKVHLLHLLGREKPVNDVVLTSQVIPECSPLAPQYLLDKFVNDRPDVLAAIEDINASKSKARLSKIDWFNFMAIADATSGSDSGHKMGPALKFPVPIFNRNQGGSSKATSEVERSSRHLETVRQQASFDIQSGYLLYSRSCDDWKAQTQEVMPLVEEHIALVEKSFFEGDISYLSSLEAQRQKLDQQIRMATLKSDLVSHWVELERSLGHFIEHIPTNSKKVEFIRGTNE